MNLSDIKTEEKEVKKNAPEELSLDDLNEVSGAGSPFEDIPRVPLKPIDDNLRENG